MTAHQWIALIPAYEPGPELPELVHQARRAGLEPVVVDDGSGEAWRETFAQLRENAAVITHERNRGKGRAIKTGLAYIRENFAGSYVVVTLDADGQHNIGDALRVCQAAQEQPDALILGSRTLNRKDVPRRSRFGNAVTCLVYRLVTGLSIQDTQTGLRAFSSQLLPELAQIAGERYEYEMRVLLHCARRRIPVRELPIQTIYIDNNAASHFSTVKDSCRVYGEILKFSASSFTGFLVDFGLFSLLVSLTGRLTVSNVCARAVSASVNFTINRTLVFKSKEKLLSAALQYFAMAAAILLANTLLLRLLADGLGLNRYIAKLGVELAMFSVSYFVQRKVIFRRRPKAQPHPQRETR
ncbi:MAG: bifunctional glycosyltransferase family 2/GtrA family protein [Oscillospiraceae bacterium]|nr:bifunctional glycosyltransferase family 2/GtrA family protein [Oscillospiraceae bacterium]